jgi:hypothetical protein
MGRRLTFVAAPTQCRPLQLVDRIGKVRFATRTVTDRDTGCDRRRQAGRLDRSGSLPRPIRAVGDEQAGIDRSVPNAGIHRAWARQQARRVGVRPRAG